MQGSVSNNNLDRGMPLQDILIGLYLIIKYLMDFMKDSFPDFACKYFDLH